MVFPDTLVGLESQPGWRRGERNEVRTWFGPFRRNTGYYEEWACRYGGRFFGGGRLSEAWTPQKRAGWPRLPRNVQDGRAVCDARSGACNPLAVADVLSGI